jgi:hypothetical protein
MSNYLIPPEKTTTPTTTTTTYSTSTTETCVLKNENEHLTISSGRGCSIVREFIKSIHNKYNLSPLLADEFQQIQNVRKQLS